jgi:hypothetical protein
MKSIARAIIPALLCIASLLCIACGGVITLGIYSGFNQWTDVIFYCAAIVLLAFAYMQWTIDSPN